VGRLVGVAVTDVGFIDAFGTAVGFFNVGIVVGFFKIVVGFFVVVGIVVGVFNLKFGTDVGFFKVVGVFTFVGIAVGFLNFNVGTAEDFFNVGTAEDFFNVGTAEGFFNVGTAEGFFNNDVGKDVGFVVNKAKVSSAESEAIVTLAEVPCKKAVKSNVKANMKSCLIFQKNNYRILKSHKIMNIKIICLLLYIYFHL
jgi:hypothetical protein